LSQDFNYRADIQCSLFFVSKKLSVNFSPISKELLSKLSPSLQKAVSLAQEEGASSWLTALPVQEHGTKLPFMMHLL